MFTHVDHGIVLPKMKQVTLSSGKRTYETPEGNIYPSVTTVLAAQPNPGLDRWRKRVGPEEADRVSKRASLHGNKIHAMAEKYLLNEDWKDGYNAFQLHFFENMKTVLDKYVDNIWMLETRLYSDYLKTAGTVDCIAEFNGKLSVIDFKTSRAIKKRKWIKNYFVQESFYAIAFEERTKKPIKQLVTIITGQEGVQVFVEDRDSHIHDFIRMRDEYISIS